MAAPVGGQVLSEVLPYLELEKIELTEEEKSKKVEVPNIIGLSIQDAKKALKEVGLGMEEIKNEYQEKESLEMVVNSQFPKATIWVKEGTAVYVEFEEKK